jgi:hypothetical protein
MCFAPGRRGNRYIVRCNIAKWQGSRGRDERNRERTGGRSSDRRGGPRERRRVDRHRRPALPRRGAPQRAHRPAAQLSAIVAKDTGLASWAALPSIVAAASLLIAVLGMYWDISLHIDDGRDAGPLANPAHYLILVGLYGIFTAGFLAIVLPEGRPSRAAVRISGDWYAPLGGIAMIASAAFALIGFPLDDVWHASSART